MINHKLRPEQPRWFTVIASREVSSESMQFSSSTDVSVLALNDSDAMKKVRLEFPKFYLRVVK